MVDTFVRREGRMVGERWRIKAGGEGGIEFPRVRSRSWKCRVVESAFCSGYSGGEGRGEGVKG